MPYPEALALARHHKVPSRLLDWSSDSLIAAFFSAYNCAANDNISVWALNKKYLGSNLVSGQISFYDRLSKMGLEFLHLQRGLFTDMIGIDTYYYEYGRWPTLDEYLLKTYTTPDVNVAISQDSYLKKIELNFSEKENLLRLLNRMGISKHSLMPTYDNVGLSVKT
jgi:hypothetical protein